MKIEFLMATSCASKSGAAWGVDSKFAMRDILHQDRLGATDFWSKLVEEPAFSLVLIKRTKTKLGARPKAARLLEPSMTARIDSDRLVPTPADSRRDGMF